MQTDIKEIPIFFRPEMVRAILEGRKTMTRRIMKVQPHSSITDITWGYSCLTPPRNIELRGKFIVDGEKRYGSKFFKCRYGQRNDILWVRETWMRGGLIDENEERGDSRYWYAADNDWQHIHWYYEDRENDDGYPRWKPCIHMPKEACRLRLNNQSIRVERLQDISEEDAKAEGAPCGIYREGPNTEKGEFHLEHNNHGRYIDGFRFLWQTINGRDSWEANPWVWVISFEKK